MDLNEEVKAAMATRDAAIIKRLESIDRMLSENSKKWDEREEFESKLGSPGRTLPGSDSELHVKAFGDWILKPHDEKRKAALGEFQDKLVERKYINLGSNADGAFAVPKVIAEEIEKEELKLSPVRNLVKVVRSSTSDFHHLMDINGTTSGWVGETDARSETNTPQLRDRQPTFGEVYAYPRITEWASDDMFFNVQSWLTDSVAEEFARQTGIAVLTGNGTNKPTGMLNTTPVTTADDASPKRAADAYQYLLGGDNSPASVDGDALIDLVYATNSKYRANATFVMNSVTTGQVRKLKDSVGQYLWQPSLVAGQPDRLFGYPVACWENLSDPLGGSFPLAFGDFRRAYLLVDRTDLRITFDNITEAGFLKFYCRRRTGGRILNNDAVKFLKLL
jgi:HK97 family phage major capsid protein